jgi:hypothetical protein
MTTPRRRCIWKVCLCTYNITSCESFCCDKTPGAASLEGRSTQSSRLIVVEGQDENDTGGCGRWHNDHRAPKSAHDRHRVDKESCSSWSSQKGEKERWIASRCFGLAWKRHARFDSHTARLTVWRRCLTYPTIEKRVSSAS